MGSFYTNITLKGPNQAEVVAHLNAAGRNAYVSPTEGGYTVVYDEIGDTQDTGALATLSSELSGEFGCPVLVILNHDDDILWYELYIDGECKDTYNSCPGYFDSCAPQEPVGGDARLLCETFGKGDPARVEAILRADEEYVFALDRHEELVAQLGWPDATIGAGFAYISQGEVPPGLDEEELVQTGASGNPPGGAPNLRLV
jgi:hypothetical protein